MPNRNTRLPVRPLWGGLAFAALLLILMASPANAAATDLFASGKEVIKKTAGDGSMVEHAIFAAGAIGAMMGGIISRNWFGAIGGFITGMAFWEIIKPLIGLS